MKKLIVFLCALLCTVTCLASTQQCKSLAGTWQFPVPGAGTSSYVFTQDSHLTASGTFTDASVSPACVYSVSGTWSSTQNGWPITYGTPSPSTCTSLPVQTFSVFSGSGGQYPNTGWHGCMTMDRDSDTQQLWKLSQCKVPTNAPNTGEGKSVSNGFQPPLIPGAALFDAKFADTSFDFSGRQKREVLGTASGCVPITTFNSPGVGSTWLTDDSDYSVGPPSGSDEIGDKTLGTDLSSAVYQIRANLQQALPCTVVMTQTMQIDCDDGSGNLSWTLGQYEQHNINETVDIKTFKVQRNTRNGDAPSTVFGSPREFFLLSTTPLCPMTDSHGTVIVIFECAGLK